MTYARSEAVLSGLDHVRDLVAGQIKQSLDSAEYRGTPVSDTFGQLLTCNLLLAAAIQIAR